MIVNLFYYIRVADRFPLFGLDKKREVCDLKNNEPFIFFIVLYICSLIVIK